ncbi:hypothetical protein BN1002_03937 [Bacillus sp. B-jedd]|nr:hypothetical protein BN1002_03937 [Bacillus sp. B-jedd]
MCVSNNVLEIQTNKLSDEIRLNTIFTPVAFVYHNGQRVNLGASFLHQAGFIKRVVLQDTEGNVYEVDPTENGLRFAKGEISYRDYQLLEKKENRKAITLFTGAIGFLFLIGWAFLQLVG